MLHNDWFLNSVFLLVMEFRKLVSRDDHMLDSIFRDHYQVYYPTTDIISTYGLSNR